MRISIFFLAILLCATSPVFAFGSGSDGCGAGECRDCHSLDVKEATDILGKTGLDKIDKVEFSEMPGLFVVDVEKDGQKFPVFIDFSKQYIVSGNIIRLSDGHNITQDRVVRKPKKPTYADPSRIPLDDALLLGSADAKIKVIVFTDPECPFCSKLHEEIKQVTEQNSDIAYLIKMMPLAMHKNAYPIAKNIVCDRDMKLLELSFASIGNKEQLRALAARPSLCTTDAVDQTLAVAGELGIRSTPTLVYPSGLIDSGYKKAEQLAEIARTEAGTAK